MKACIIDIEASLESYGIEDSNRINVVNVPSNDTNPIVSKALTSFLFDRCPANVLPAIAEKYHIVSNFCEIRRINE